MLLTPWVVGIAVVVSLLVIGAFLVVRWRDLRSHNRRYLGAIMTIQTVVLAGIAYTFWPLLPSSQVTAMETADQFLSRWSSGQSDEAKQLMAGIDVEKAWLVVEDPLRAPVRWTLEQFNPRNRIALGRGQLATQEDIDIAIFLDWNGLNNTWVVTGAEWTTPDRGHPVGIYLIYDNGVFLVLTWILCLVGWVSIGAGVWRIRVLIVAWRRHHRQRVAHS